LELQKQQEEEEEEEEAALKLDTVFILFTKKFAFLVRHLLLLLPEFQNPNKKPRRSSKSVHV
jgi:DNA recombination-dependent growth factor C